MNKNISDEFLDDLLEGFKPVRPILEPSRSAFLWLLFCIVLSVFLVANESDFRSGYQKQLFSSPKLMLEIFFGFLSGIVAAFYAFEMAVPGQHWGFKKKLLSVLPFIIFSFLSLYSLFDPALPPSWEGWRFGCERDIMMYGAIPMIIFFILANRAAPIEKEWNGLLIGISAMAPSAALMQLACMYNPWHFLGFHLAPVILVALIGARVGKLFLKL